MNDAVTKCERAKMKFERIQRILVNEKAGVEHIVEKLEFFKVIFKMVFLLIVDEPAKYHPYG